MRASAWSISFAVTQDVVNSFSQLIEVGADVFEFRAYAAKLGFNAVEVPVDCIETLDTINRNWERVCLRCLP